MNRSAIVMEIVTIGEAKARLSQLIARACRGEEVVIARRSKPVVRLVAVSQATGPRKPGALKGKLFVTPDVFAPLTDAEMEELGFE
jgi:prevent-host-death family protein